MKKVLSYGRTNREWAVSFPTIRIVPAYSEDLCVLGGGVPNYVKKAEEEEVMGSYLKVPLRRDSF